jgi:hypothetical protein
MNDIAAGGLVGLLVIAVSYLSAVALVGAFRLSRNASQDDDFGTGTGTDGPVSSLDKGWTYPAHEPIRDRYERECI